MTVFIPRETIGRSMQSLKSIATYTIIVYLSLVCAEGLFYLYSVQYFFRPEWDEAKIRRQQDEDIKRAFLKSNPEYSGLVPKKLFKRNGAKLVRKHSFLPLGHGVPNSPLIYCNEGYGFLKYTTDRYGFHNDDAVWETERPWLLIGDSFATGACVPTEHNIASRLMEASGSTVINLGSPGQGPDVYTALARVFIALTRPQKVALVFYENDFDAPDRSIYSSETELFSPYLNVEFREATKAFYDEVRESDILLIEPVVEGAIEEDNFNESSIDSSASDAVIDNFNSVRDIGIRLLEAKEQSTSQVTDLDIIDTSISILAYQLYGDVDRVDSLAKLNLDQDLSNMSVSAKVLSD